MAELAERERHLQQQCDISNNYADQNEKLRKLVSWALGIVPTSQRRWRDAACELLDALAEAGKEAGKGEK